MIEIIQLHFKTPVHFGRGSEELDKSEIIYHSDSLKSALFAVGRTLYSSWDKEGKDFFSSFRISSCFPFSRKEYFLPKPKLIRKYKFTKTSHDLTVKKGKRIGFLSMPVFSDFCKSSDEPFLVDDDLLTADGAFLCKEKHTCTRILDQGTESPISFYRTETQQRVKVASDVPDEDTKPFYIDRVHFEEDCGLYVLAEFVNNEKRDQVIHALHLLGDLGIGTDRTVGNGLFEIKEAGAVSANFLKTEYEQGLWMSLGLFLPEKKEFSQIDLSKSQWSLLKRGGYMAGSEIEELSHLRKKSIYMFSEGSVFHSQAQLRGKVVDLKPEYHDTRLHPVWRDGQCLMLKI